MALAETLNEGFDPFASVGKVSKGGDAQTRAGTARKELEPLMRAESGMAQDIAKEETRFKKEKAKAETLAEEGFAREKRGAVEKYQAGLEQRPTFSPTEFDAPAAAQLAGLTAVIGAIAGRGRARAALKSMEGFTRGHKEGRADLYDREAKQYEKDLQGWKDNVGMAKEKLTQVIDLLSTDKTAALVKAKELDPILQEGLVLAKVKKGDYKGAMELLNSAIKSGDQAEMQFLKTVSKGAGGKIKMTTEPEKRLSGSRESLESVMSIEQRLKDPKVASAINQTTFVRTLLEKPTEMFPIDKYIRGQLFTNLPKEAQELFLQIAQARNDYYRQLSGQAVTGSEAARNFFATIQPSDTVDTLLVKIKGLKPKFIRQLEDIESDYEIGPGTQQRISELLIQARGGQPQTSVAAPAAGAERKSFASEAEADAAFASGKIQDNEKITIDGRNATYRANQ
jgi:hypothetical protein